MKQHGTGEPEAPSIAASSRSLDDIVILRKIYSLVLLPRLNRGRLPLRDASQEGRLPIAPCPETHLPIRAPMHTMPPYSLRSWIPLVWDEQSTEEEVDCDRL